MHYLIKILTLFTLFTTPLLAYVGTVTALKGEVNIQNSSVSIAATLGAQLSEKDHIVTADKSKAQLIFKDDTIITVGKNSNFSIATYLYDEKSEPIVEFGLLHGAMRTITGKIGKIAPDKFKIKTKNVTIGIRGTNFTVVTGKNGSTQAYCTYGAIRVTFNNKAYTIKQGYYVNINHDGRVDVKTFSAGELQKINNKSFEEESSNSSSDKDGVDEEVHHSVDEDNGLDVTVEDVSEETQQNLTQNTEDAVQTDKETDSNSGNYLSMSGYSIDADDITSLKSDATLRFTTDGSNFDSSESWIDVNEKSNGYDGQDDWRFFVASTPSEFITKDNYRTTFSSVSLAPGSGSSSKNAKLLESAFNATADLASDDYMTWGNWSAKVSYETEYPSEFTSPGAQETNTNTYSMQGLWVTGEVTDEAVVEAIRGKQESYIGQYNALDFQSTPMTKTGAAVMSVDFGTDRSAQLSLTDGGGQNFATFDLSISGNTLSGSSTGSAGKADGTFYGPNAESIGGNFSYGSTSSITMKGVYEVSKQINTSPLE